MVINDADTAALAPAASRPPELANAARARNHGSRIRFFTQEFLQHGIFIVWQQGHNAPGKNAGLAKLHHGFPAVSFNIRQ